CSAWWVGRLRGSLSITDKTDRDEVVFTREEIEASGLDYLALGHWHSAQQGKAGTTTWAYASAREPVAVTQGAAGKVPLLTLAEVKGVRTVTVSERVVGKTRFEHVDVDA